MEPWMCAVLVIAGAALYCWWMCWKIVRDNRPPPRWPGDP